MQVSAIYFRLLKLLSMLDSPRRKGRLTVD
jgi:hypothetical protein